MALLDRSVTVNLQTSIRVLHGVDLGPYFDDDALLLQILDDRVSNLVVGF